MTNDIAYIEPKARVTNAPTRKQWSNSQLPKNSKVGEGKKWPAPAGAKETREYRVYRWNPDDGQNPRSTPIGSIPRIAGR